MNYLCMVFELNFMLCYCLFLYICSVNKKEITNL